jgi:hypothetical protein
MRYPGGGGAGKSLILHGRWVDMENNARRRRFARASCLYGSNSHLTRRPSGSDVTVDLSDRIEKLVDRAPSVDALKMHRLHLAAARLWRSRGEAVPADLRSHERAAAMRGMLTNLVLGRVRQAYGGALMLMKGPEIAALYPFPSDRSFRDLDLLADDAPAAQRALIAAGFVETTDPTNYDKHQHLSPLLWPGLPLAVEIHRRPNQPAWLGPAGTEMLFEFGLPSSTGVDGLLAPEPAAHALLLVAHAWTHEPLGRIGDLLDVAAALEAANRGRVEVLAREWGWDRMWRTSLAATDAVLASKPTRVVLATWSRHLAALRERRVVEAHIARFAAPACSLPPGDVPGALLHVLKSTVAPGEHEGWKAQVHRSFLAVAHAFRGASDHEHSLPARELSSSVTVTRHADVSPAARSSSTCPLGSSGHRQQVVPVARDPS